jgi:hypothetical protein
METPATEKKVLSPEAQRLEETAKKSVRKIGDILRYPQFHQEVLQQKRLTDDDFLNLDFIILDAKVIEDFHSQFKTGPTAQILGCYDPNDVSTYFKALSSHKAIVGKIEKLIKAKAFPVEVRVIRVTGGSYDGYYDFANDK